MPKDEKVQRTWGGWHWAQWSGLVDRAVSISINSSNANVDNPNYTKMLRDFQVVRNTYRIDRDVSMGVINYVVAKQRDRVYDPAEVGLGPNTVAQG